VEKLGVVLGVEPRVRRAPRPAGEMDVTFADITRANQRWGWRPTVSLDAGLLDFATWIRAEEQARRNP
jgi:UDP-glucuronate 4-epimerase